MGLAIVLRIVAYLTFLIGALMFLGVVTPSIVTQLLHLGLGATIVLLAIPAIPSGPGPRLRLRHVARFFPTIPLVIGLLLYFDVLPRVWVMVHALLGVIAVGLLEMALSRRSRPR